MKSLRIALGLLTCFAAASAFALDATLSWTAPVKFTDGSNISKPITYSIYNRAGRIQSNITATSFFIGGAPADQNCWRVTATVDGVESAKSVEACKSLVPRAPAGISAK
jgi:hypothetical protein